MSEETQKDPRDLNGDGKVSFDEKFKAAADKASKKISEIADEMAENAKDLYDKASPKAKEIFSEVKGNADKLMDDAAELMDKAKDKIDFSSKL